METPELEIEKLKTQLDNQRKETALILHLADKQYPKNNLPAHINILTALALVKQDLVAKDLHTNLNEAGNLVLKQKKDGVLLDYFLDNKKIDVPGLIDATLIANRFIDSRDQETLNIKSGNNSLNQHLQQDNPSNNPVVNEINMQLQELSLI